jgi:hypothetical protein
MGFRLDPGEPGMLRRGKASQSTLLVTAQEHRNLARLKSQAIREGRVIMHAGIRFGRAFQGPYLTTTSGLTTVMSREPRPSVFETEAARHAAEPGREPPGPQALSPADEPTAGELHGQRPRDVGRVLAEQENLLRAELRRLESPGIGEPAGRPTFPGAEGGEDTEDPLMPLEDLAERRAEAGRQQQAREVEDDLRRINFLKMTAELAAAPAGELALTA